MKNLHSQTNICVKPSNPLKIDDKYKKELFDYLKCKLSLSLKLNKEQEELLKKAYEVAFAAHENVRRKVAPREPYITHPVEVAIITANEMGLDLTAVIGALLHDVVEDSETFDLKFIENEFGQEVKLIVDGVTKMTSVGGKPQFNTKLETLRKLIFSIPKEYRVILVKIADRLHNMRTMDGMPERTQKIKSLENLFIYAPFAKSIGMYDIKNELEDLSFKYLYPDEYYKIKHMDEQIKPFRDQYLNALKLDISKILSSETNYSFKIKRIKHSYYEIWNKLKNNKHISFFNINNVESLRIVFETQPNYSKKEIAQNIRAKILNHYNEVSNTFHDWITHPKPNGFTALVFDIIYRHQPTLGHIQQTAEIQILSKEDDIIAQKGANIANLKKSILSQDQTTEDSFSNFINRILKNVNTQTIFVYTPNGDIIELPKKSTVIDLAFYLDTNLGLHCMGANINNKISRPPTYILQSGELVQIIDAQKKKPELQWLEYVQTEKAKRELEKFFGIRSDQKPKNSIKFQDSKIIIDNSTKPILASCCNPVPGEDNTVAIINENGELEIHKQSCNTLTFQTNFLNRKAYPVIWRLGEYLFDIRIESFDRPALLKDILTIISEALKLDIYEISMRRAENGMVKGQITIRMEMHGNKQELKRKCSKDSHQCDIDAIHKLISKLKEIKEIRDIQAFIR